MKKVSILWALVLVLIMSVAAGATSFQADGSYLFGFGEQTSVKSESRGLLVNGSVEIVPNLLADGSFLTLNYTKLGAEEITAELPEKAISERVITIGGLYRVVTEPDLQVVVGAGLADYKVARGKNDPEVKTGKGIYGKLGFTFQVMPKANLLADLSYAPKFKNDEKDGTLLTARATVSYDLVHDISVQGTVKYYKTDIAGVTSTNTMVGGGLVLSF
jgi:hypothetical protein